MEQTKIKPNEETAAAMQAAAQWLQSGSQDKQQFVDIINRLCHASFRQGYKYCLQRVQEKLKR